ncbi:MAG: YhcH/YjgK/YiaL family protein [Kiritimatiellae bacterium]|nr:YhcH/YjgK/YiaL family protein [Kiritimatiellia bacterium]
MKKEEGVYISDSLASFGGYAGIGRHFAKAAEFLARKDLFRLPNGRYALDGENAYAMIQETQMKEWGGGRPEVHREYFDVHLPVSGEETIGVAKFDPKTAGDFNDDEDVGFYDDVKVEPLTLKPGEFVILYPRTCAHVPCCTMIGATVIRKIVVKLHRALAAALAFAAVFAASAPEASAAGVTTKYGHSEYVKYAPEAKTKVAAVIYALTDDFKHASRCPVKKLNDRGYAVVTLDCTKLSGRQDEARAAAIKAVKKALADDPDIDAECTGVILDKVQVGWDEVEANWMELADSYDRKGWNADPSKVARTRPFTVLAWNLEGGNETPKEIASLVAFLKDVRPDAMLISEQYGKLPAILEGLGAGWQGERFSMNLALISRWPIAATARPFEAPWNYLDPTGPFNFGFGEIVVQGQRVRTCPLWMNWELGKPRFSNLRTDEMKGIIGSIQGAIAEADEVPIVIGGDFNDYVHPHEQMMAKAGFTDTYRKFHPELDGTNAYTWASPAGNRRHFIDYIFSKGAKLRPVASEIFHSKWHKPFDFRGRHYESFPSDHGFVLTSFELELPTVPSRIFLTKGENRTESPIAYRDEPGCVLELRHPVGVTGFPTVVWLHGGGLTSGKRAFIPLDVNRIAVAAVDYRLMPKVGPDVCIDDAAAAAALVKKRISEFGGDPDRVFVGGHSAGAYLTFMLGLDKRWLGKYGLSPFDFAGYMPLSGQVTKHFAVRKHFKDRVNSFQPVVDEWAPMHYLSPKTPRFCVVVGDPRIEWRMRAEENEFMYKSLKAMGNTAFEFHSAPETNHGTCRGPAMPIFQRFIDSGGNNGRF